MKNIIQRLKIPHNIRDKQSPFLIWVSIVFMVMILTFLLTPISSIEIPGRPLRIGDIASRDIKAPRDFLIEDKASTEKNKKEAEEGVRPVYDFDTKIIEDTHKKVSDAFRLIQEIYLMNIPNLYSQLEEIESVLSAQEDEVTAEKRAESKILAEKLKDEMREVETGSSLKDKEEEFKKVLGIEVSQKSLKTLRWHHYKPPIVNHINHLFDIVMKRGVVGSRELLKSAGPGGIVVREIVSADEHVRDIGKILAMNEITDIINKSVKSVIEKRHRSLQRVVTEISKKLVHPNLTFNKQETELRKRMAVESAKPVFFQIKKGEMIIREGERITAEHLLKLKGLASEKKIYSTIMLVAGLILFIILILSLVWIYLQRFKSRFVRRGENLLLLCVILLINIIIAWLIIGLARAVADYTSYIDISSYLYAIPFAAGPLLVAILFDVEIGIVFTIVTSLLVGFLMEGEFSYSLLTLIGGLVAVFRVNQYKQRSAILKTGILIGGVNILTIIALDLINSSVFSIKGFHDILMGFVGGVIVAMVVSGIVPLLESIFHVTSDIKLLELSDMNHPLLRQLVLNAPGTFHHSIIVGSLAEAASESIGANSLLARVGSYYHDIGKMKKPEYFIENQPDDNKHDNLAPSMSSLIIISHVKDGVELAKENRLVERIIDFIREHHGTSLITYFYSKAKEKDDPQRQLTKEQNYRYAGPKPQTKETAIILLADSVEAASRTLTEPTHSRLQGLVHKIINDKFVDGQLDECDLTLRDLYNISESFIRILTGIFHLRIDYPEIDTEEKTREGRDANGDIFEKSAKEDNIRLSQDKNKDSEHVRRFKRAG
ncbi:MAG: HD family phosphohydrolase [Nitrospinota bacterium]